MSACLVAIPKHALREGREIQTHAMTKPSSYQTATDDELVRCFCSSRDEAAFTEIVGRYGALVLGTARQVLGCEHRAEDVHQAVFLVLARDACRIRNRDNLAGWLYGVTYRISVRVAKQHAKQNEMHGFESTSTRGALEELIERVERETVFSELNRLAEKYRTPLILKYFRDMSTAEVANALGLSTSAVAGRLRRGRNQLRMRLARQGIGFLTLAIVFEAISAEASAASALSGQTCGLCLAADSAGRANKFTESVTALANQESLQMFASNITKQLVVVGMLICVVTLGLASWPSGTRHAHARDGDAAKEFVVSPSAQDGNKQPAVPLIAALPAQDADRPASGQTNEQRIAASMKSSTSCEFSDAPLSEVLQSLGQRHGIQIVLDQPGLSAEGVSSDTPISINVSDIRLRNAFTLILRPLRLSAVVTEEVLLVTSEQSARDYTTSTQVYLIDDRKWRGSIEELIALVQSKVEPSSWENVGGHGSISGIEGGLVVRQAKQVHDELVALLDQLVSHSAARARVRNRANGQR